MEKYLSGTVCYFGNIFIMKRQIFHDYCAWLFPILEEFDNRTDTIGYGSQERRVDGYLGERLLGIYAGWLVDRASIQELPRVHFVPNGRERQSKCLLNVILPPGSRRRAGVKRFCLR